MTEPAHVPDPAQPASGRLLGPADIRRLAGEIGLRPTKQRGQNFVGDGNTIRRIVAAARLRPDDVVLEVGPGLGSLTLGLLEVADRVTAVEIDPVLAQRLPATVAERAGEAASRLQVVTADALRLTEIPGRAPTALVANLPYNVAVPVLLHLLELLPSVASVLVLVQFEVAERLAAGPGSKTYGVPSLKAAWYGPVELAGRVPRTVFWPVPNVDSGLVRLVRRDPPGDEQLKTRVFAAVDAAFGQRRKTLRSSLARVAGSAAASEAALRRAGVDPGLRGEALGLAEFVAIGRALAEPA